MRANSADLVILVVLTVIFSGVVAASLTRVALMEPREAFVSPEKAHSGNASLVSKGKKLFTANCAGCHSAEKTEGKYGPGFKGLSKAGKLPVTSREATESNIRSQLKAPVKSMPVFDKLTDEEIRALAAYLLSL
jgi:mono/diheme cytochrome c family protein